MVNVKSLISDKLEAWVPVRGYGGLKIKVGYISRPISKKIREDSTEKSWDPKLGTMVETLNEDKFIDLFVEHAIKDWSGMTVAVLARLVPVDASAIEDKDQSIPYSHDDAVSIVKESTVLDEWLNQTVMNLESFRNRN
tara:strand:- start:5599 stop:6012 length:414 start_codon:yes stop_codon:yes gene_type:complete